MNGRKRMKQHTTDSLLTLGMALTADKRAMERRVRGVFERKTSARAARLLSLALALALTAGGFTTACQPGERTQGAVFSPIPTEAPQTQAAGGSPLGETEVLAHDAEITRSRVLRIRDAELENGGAFPAPRLGNYDTDERGNWSERKSAGAEAAKAAFLAVVNRVFYASYTADDLNATYYRDNTGVRANVWRLDSTDGALSGALNADTLRFLSAQCKTIPKQKRHESLLAAGKEYDSDTQRSLLNGSGAVMRVADALGVTVNAAEYSSYQTSYHLTYGWGVCEDIQFSLDDGTFCTVLLFGDERLTPYAFAVYPDENCLIERVYWHADLQWAKNTVRQKDPVDFRVGEPQKGDMSRGRALEIYRSLALAMGCGEAEPDATFYEDRSGVRENYWHLRSDGMQCNIASKTGHPFQVVVPGEDRRQLDLPAVSFEDSVMRQYEKQTRLILEAALGQGAIASVEFNSVSDDTNGTVLARTPDGATYAVLYTDRAVCTIDYYIPLNEGENGLFRNWRANYTYVDQATNATFLSQN